MITANINSLPLNEVLKDLSGRFQMEVKGKAVGSEPVTLSTSSVTLEEMLKKLMRGYNYVLIKPDKSDKSILMVLSKAERTKYTEPSVAGTVAAPPSVPPATVKVPVAPPVVSSSATMPPAGAAKTDVKKDTESVTPVYEGGGSSSSMSASASSAGSTGDTVKILTSSGTVKEISASLLPPMPPSLSGGDTPPSIPVVTAGTQVDTPPSIPQASTASTDSTAPGGQQQQTGQQSATSAVTTDLKPPQIPF